MDNNNNNNNNGDEDEDEQQQVEHQLAEAEAAVERMELILVVLERKEKAPIQTRNKIDVLVEKFLQDLGDDIHDMLCNTDDPDSDNYRGLDSNRDTVAEVETVIRLFPDVISKQGRHGYPIQCLALHTGYYRLNLKTCSFMSVLARLAIEFGSFEEQYRGGLMCRDDNHDTVLEYLVRNITFKQEYQELTDNVCLDVMKELKEIGLMVKEDILRYDLLMRLCQNYYFGKERFRFLVEWDPTALMHTNQQHKCVPLDFAVRASPIAFYVTFDAGIRYFPKKKGISLLFHIDEDDETPFQYACKNYAREKAMKVIEDTLTYYHSGTPLNIADALLSAAIDDGIHLDCVYFLLRREPDVLQKLISAKAESAEAMAEGDEDNNSEVIRKRKRKS
jgi:hypothetical protein